jgi:RNA polymerase primary sigma factor
MTRTMEASTQEFEGESELALHQYKQDTKGFSLLSAEQERNLACRIQAGLTLTREHVHLPYGGFVSRMIVYLSADAQDAQDALCYGNLRLVVALAKHYMNHGLSLMDLIEEGNIGLIRATHNYNPNKSRFSTHATWWIRQALGRAVMERGDAIHVPTHANTVINKVSRVATTLVTSLGREATAEEIAEAAHLTPEQVEDALHWKSVKQVPMSLDEEVGEHSDYPLFLRDFIEDTRQPMEEQTASQLAYRAAIETAMQSLSKREQAVIRRRFGLDGESSGTLIDIGREFGVCRERIRQIEAVALAKLAPRLKWALRMEEVSA